MSAGSLLTTSDSRVQLSQPLASTQTVSQFTFKVFAINHKPILGFHVSKLMLMHKPKTSSGFTCHVKQQRIYDYAADTASLLDIRPIDFHSVPHFGLVPVARYIHTRRHTIQNHRPTMSAKLSIDHHSSPAIGHATNSHHRPNSQQSSRSNPLNFIQLAFLSFPLLPLESFPLEPLLSKCQILQFPYLLCSQGNWN